MKRFLILPVLAVAMLAPAQAGEPLSPEAAVALAVSNHPLGRAAAHEVAAAEADVRLARSGFLPRIDLTEDWVRSTNPVFVFASKLGQERFAAEDFDLGVLNSPSPLTNAATRISVRQNVWDAGRTHLYGRAAADGVRASEESLARTRDQIAFGALRAFWDAVLADAMLAVSRAGEEAAKANVALATHHVEAGIAVPSDRMSAEVRLAEVQALRIRAEQGVAVSRAALRQALGLGADREYDLVPPRLEPRPSPDDPEALVAEALASRSDLRSLDARLAQAETGTRIARSRYWPEVGVGAGYEWNGDRLFGADGGNWSAGVSVRVPVFEGTETAARVAKARAELERVRAQREAMAEGIRLEARAAWADRVAADERLRVAASAVEQADEALRIVRERYAEGMVVMVELLGAEAAALAAKGNRAAAERDVALATAALDLAAGRRLAPAKQAEKTRHDS